MARNNKKTENVLSEVVDKVAKKKTGKNTNKTGDKLVKKSVNKSSKIITKGTIKKSNKKEINKTIKKEEIDGLNVNNTTFKVRRSRKKKEELNDIFVVDSKIEDENVKNIDIENENLNVDDKNELNENVNEKSYGSEEDEVVNNENSNSSLERVEKGADNANDMNIDEIFRDDDYKIENKKNIEKPKEKKHISKMIFVGVVIAVILFFAIFIATKTMKTVIPNVTIVNNITDLNKKMNASIVPPGEVKNVQYGIEGDGIARMDYVRKSKNGTMNLIFRMAKDPDKDLYGEYHSWGERIIHIDVECSDGIIINVESYEALDDTTTLIALWKDNNEYYSLFTKNISTKEDFYREVNQIVATNHKA